MRDNGWPAGARLEPRPYQQRIVRRAVELFADHAARSVLIDSPTGSGKTIMGLLIARWLHECLGVRVGWVAMRRYLLSQAAAENEATGLRVPCTYLSMFDKDPPTGLDLLVVDEAQHDAASSMAHLHNLIRPRFILGLSATPFRSDRVKLCFDTVLKDAGIGRLIQDGYLSRYHHYTLPAYTPQAVAKCYLREPGRWGKTIIYFHTLEQCHAADRLLRAGGIRSDVVSGETDRGAQLAAFRAGALDVLLNCVVLGEGFDCPELRTVFCRPSCKAVTIQMGGRVLRKHPEVPIKQIVQCPKTRWPFVRTAAAALQHRWVEGVWRTLEVSPRIEQASRQVLCALARIPSQLPRYLAERQRRSPGAWFEERRGREQTRE